MTHVLLCAGPTLRFIDEDGSLYYRRPGQPDVEILYSRRNFSTFFHSARYKHDLSRVIGPAGEENPEIPEGTSIPELRSERLSTGETVYRLVPIAPSSVAKNHIGDSSRGVEANPSTEILARR